MRSPSSANSHVTDTRLDALVAAENLDKLSPRERELRLSVLWMLEICANLDEHVSPDAGDAVRTELRERSRRSAPTSPSTATWRTSASSASSSARRHSLRRWVTQPIARELPWTWKYGNYRYLEGLFAIALGLAALRALCAFLANIAAAGAVLEVITRLRRALYLQTYRRGGLAFRALGPNEAVRISTRDLEALHEGLFVRLTASLREPAKFVLVLVVRAPRRLLACPGVLPLRRHRLACRRSDGGPLPPKIRADQVRTGNQLTLIQESLMLMRLAKLYLMEAFNQARFEKQLASYATAQKRRYRSEAIYRPLFTLLALVAAFGILYLGANLLLQGTWGSPGR